MLGFPHAARLQTGPLACVLGDMDLVRPLGLAGVRCAVLAPEGSWLRHSRYAARILPLDTAAMSEDEFIEALMAFGAGEAQQPVLFFEEDAHLLMVSRHRHRLAAAFRFVLPQADFIEQLVDKARFQQLAQEKKLPVPRARVLHPGPDSSAPDLDLSYPIVVKPLTRRESWAAIEQRGKAIQLDHGKDLAALWPTFTAAGIELLAQELIPGPESCIESYHVYVDHEGEVAGEFTGRKIRTFPAAYGHSTALTITDSRGEASDVTALGRDVAARIDLRGVAKFDFKRAPDGTLHLLEINPRFNLWHHLGAVAGVNLPALVYADLTGRERPRTTVARAGPCWCRLNMDRRAARETGMSTLAWLRWAARCEASPINLDDPMPFLKPKFRRLIGMSPRMRRVDPPAVSA